MRINKKLLLNSIELKNYKAFEELSINFSKITLLTGANSTGKSSIINSLLAVLQSEQFPFYLSPNGQYVDMGGYEEIISGGQISKELEINISFNVGISSYWKRPKRKQTVTYETTWRENPVNSLTSLEKISIKSDEIDLNIIQQEKGKKKYYKLNVSTVHFGHILKRVKEGLSNIKKVVNGGRILATGNGISFAAYPYASVTELINDTFLNNNEDFFYFRHIFETISKFANEPEGKFNFIGSFRQPPERTYYQKSKSQGKILSSGEGYIDQLIEWEERGDERLSQVKEAVKNLEIIHNFKSNKLKGGRFELLLQTSEMSHPSSLSDVGFGISQFLPIIVADMQLGKGSLLAVSQPEIHLHPKVQANFANYLHKQSQELDKQYIIETHSEYLINRFRFLIASGEMEQQDISTYYLEKSGENTIIHKIIFQKDGQMIGAPKSFFDTYMMESINISMAVISDEDDDEHEETE